MRSSIKDLLGIRSIESITDHVVENDIGPCTVTETWLNDADSASIAQLSVAGYFSKNCLENHKTVVVELEFCFETLLTFHYWMGRKTSPSNFLSVLLKCTITLHVIVCRTQDSSLRPVSASVFDEFSQFLENVVTCPEVLVISGDFNFHLDDLCDNDTKKFMDLLETFRLSQHVSGPTHLSGHTLDLIITPS